jgi:tRNA 2-selenouridine synthase
MAMRMIPAAQALAYLADFDAIIDARSESEYAEDHLPGAVNWPTLSDEERARVGTEYKKISAFHARKHGAVLAARNIATHIDHHAAALPQNWRPLVYCWRGGQRSGALGTVLGAIGFTVQVLEGGYREFRRAVLADLDQLPLGLDFRVLCGRTGSAKSRLLQALAAEGAQVLDLEALAAHRGSVLGPLPGQPQPSQKAFETAVWQTLRTLRPGQPVFAESESRTIGRLRVPGVLMDRLRASPCIEVQMPVPSRVQFLLQDYGHFLDDGETFCARLDALRDVQGHAQIDAWQSQARAGQWAEVVEQLLLRHYDPVYARSTARNYQAFERAEPLALHEASPEVLRQAAQALMLAQALAQSLAQAPAPPDHQTEPV